MSAISAAMTRATALTPVAAVQLRAASKKASPGTDSQRLDAKKAAVVNADKELRLARHAVRLAITAAEKETAQGSAAAEAKWEVMDELAAMEKAAALKKENAEARVRTTLRAKEIDRAAERKAIADKKKAIQQAAGPVNPYALFLAKSTKGLASCASMKEIAAKWKNLPDAEKEEYVAEARKNRAIREEVKASFKKPVTKFVAFTKAHFPAVYAANLEKTTDRREAFRLSGKEIAAMYRASQSASTKSLQ